jgi:hypothetical protein
MPTMNKVETAYAIGAETSFTIIEFDNFCSMMGHLNNEVLRETAKSKNIQLTGAHHCPCAHCTMAKFRMKNIPKLARTIVPKKSQRFLVGL